jgi:hypothetical protein
MSEFRFRRLEERRVGGVDEQMLLSYPVPRSPSGKVYRYSPNPEAVPRLFLIGDAPAARIVPEGLRARMRLEPGSSQTICPYSGHVDADSEFVHFEDVEAVKKQIAWEVEADLGDFLSTMASDFNRRQRPGGFISVKMEVKGSRPPKPFAIRTDLLRDLECDVCRRPYAVYAIALFCPDCGAPNVSQHFRREAALVGEEVGIADRLDSERRSEIAYRLLGNAHEDVLTAFEATLKTVYRHLVRERLPQQSGTLCAWKEIGNAFQNIDRAREKFRVLSIDPFSHLSDDELELMLVNIQKRHVIGHNLGVADERYGELTDAEQPGETVRLMGEQITGFAGLCLGVVETLERDLLPGNAKAP